ncbi:MAG: hypothetical protein ABSC05_28940 [Candidatus Solibacter sp.]
MPARRPHPVRAVPVEEDDDRGGGTNARIASALPAGTYHIVAQPFGDYTSHGAYTLTTQTP